MIPVILSDGNLMLSCFGHDGTGIMMIHIHLNIQSGETGQGSCLPPARTSVVDVLYPKASQILDWCLKYDNIHIKVSLVYQRLVEWLRC